MVSPVPKDGLHTERSGLLGKTKLAIDTLQEELCLAKQENERLRKSGEAKGQQFKELQTQLDAQQQRLLGLDGRLVQGQGALAAACAAAQSREAEVLALKQLNASREKMIHDQAEAAAKLERRAAEGDALVAALREKEATLSAAVQELQQRFSTKDGELRVAISNQEQLRSNLDAARASLLKERSQWESLGAQHEAVGKQWADKLAKCEQEWKTKAESEKAAVLAEAAALAKGAAGAGEASTRQWAELLAKERENWVAERSRLLQDCHARLEHAEKWLELAARDSDAQRERSVAAANQAAMQMQQLEVEWAQKLHAAVAAARTEERQLAQSEAVCHPRCTAEHEVVDEKIAWLQRAMADDFEQLRGQIERCLEALADRVLRQQAKVEKRQGNNIFVNSSYDGIVTMTQNLNSHDDHLDVLELQLVAERLRESRKAPSSKYDFVKIKVWLGENQEHYYILSRFLIARMLTVTRVPQDKAVKIALEVKKWLVDNNKLGVSQDEFEAVLFESMRARSFGQEYVDRFRMVNRFQQQKRPLIVLICGTACTGKSTLAQQLSSRLNLPNVLSTDALRDLLKGYPGAPLPDEPLWSCSTEETFNSTSNLVAQFQTECTIMRRALDGDLVKCVADGKSIIIEGLYLDPGLYLQEFGNAGLLEGHRKSTPLPYSINDSEPEAWMKQSPGSGDLRSEAIASLATIMLQGDEGVLPIASSNSNKKSSSRVLNALGAPTNVVAGARNSACADKNAEAERLVQDPFGRVAKIDRGLLAHGGPVFIPIVLRVDPGDYEVLAQEWLAEQVPGCGIEREEARQRAVERLLCLQEYLEGYRSAGVPVVNVGVADQQETLDQLHEYVLSCIELSLKEPDEGGGKLSLKM